MRLHLLDMQRALYLWSNSSYTQDMEKGSVLEPGFCLGLCRWEIHTLKLLNIKKGPETGRQPSVFNPFSMGYHWKKLERVFFTRNLFREERPNTCHREKKNDNFCPASTQCKQAITQHVITSVKCVVPHFLTILVASSTPYEQNPIFCLRWKGDSTWLKPLRSPQPKFWLVNLVLSRQTGCFECEHPFIDKPMVTTEPAVPSTQLLGLGSKLYPSNILCMLNKDLTRFMQYDKIEQPIERRCWQGVASTEYIGNQIKFNKNYAKELSPKTLVPHVFHTFSLKIPLVHLFCFKNDACQSLQKASFNFSLCISL